MPSSYVEWRVPGWRHVAVLWQQSVDNDHDQLVLPDACADIIGYDDGTAQLVGPTMTPEVAHLAAGTTIHGLRLRPGSVRAALGIPANELRGQVLPLDDVVDRAASELLTRAAFRNRRAAAALQNRWADSDRRIDGVIADLGRDDAPDIDDVASAAGLSGRQLRRLVVEHAGVGPKELQRVQRLHRFLRAAASSDSSLADLAAQLGYADQAHLTRDVKRLTGLTPAALLHARSG
ncbi:helix-turn-helix transcriptional regulator [Antrihabitans cavernicola]|uniref:Helix-turn-helix domain-containing protein n=1 Tax=Antrihabitans cavernicola TaxID=2495913 RepID=A0A5A7SCC5_9NOCA|nr:helix-turn-helix domain-containing protein [Spelaeibacter cavernicola]KAA0022243.1 helix-turn-helix domain-containing protein [Spelaeibacter cavernicola]